MTTNAPTSRSTERFTLANGFSFSNAASLPRLLRSVGALALLAAISIFLLQGWQNGNDIYRYALLLGHTVLLASVGFASGHWLRESKGARLLLIIALASVPANFAILGAFVYSQAALDTLSVWYPSTAHWQAHDLRSALLAAIAGAAFLVPVSWLGFMVLSRKSATRLTLLYLLTNTALLIPLRTTEWVGAILLLLTFIVLTQSKRAAVNDAALRTPEGIIARLLQYVPLGVILGRNLWLYAADTLLFTVLSGIVYLMLRQVSVQLHQSSRLRVFLEHCALLPALAIGIGASFLTAQALRGADALLIPVFSLTVAALLVETALRAARGAAFYRRLAAVVVTLGMVVNLVLIDNAATAAVCLLVGLLVLVYGFVVEQRSVFALGVITLLAGLVYQVQLAVYMFDLGSWGSLAVLGVTAIVAGSVVERYGTEIKAKLADWGKRFKAWQN